MCHEQNVKRIYQFKISRMKKKEEERRTIAMFTHTRDY